MNAVVPVAVILLTGFTWALALYRHHRLFRSFIAKYPTIAQRDIPFALTSSTAHPEKLFYFFRRRSREFLKRDPQLWRLTKQFLICYAFAVLVPLFTCGFLFTYALLESRD